MQRTVGNRALQRAIDAKQAAGIQPPVAIQRETRAPLPATSGTHTITNSNAILRGDPPDFKSMGTTLPVGARIDVVETQISAKRPKGTFVKVAEHGTGKELGWTSQANLGDVQYANAAASFVYVATVKPRPGHAGTLPVMVYVPPKYDGTNKTDVVLYYHGDAANYTAAKANDYTSENAAIGMNLPGLTLGANQIVIAPQGNEWTDGGKAVFAKSPWHTLQAGDHETIVQTVFTNLKDDLKLTGAIPRGIISIAGHSGGGKALGQAAKDLDNTKKDGGVRDVTLVEAGYGGRENKKGEADGVFAQSFQMVRDWLLEGNPDKVLRVLTKAPSAGTDTRRAIESTKRQEAAGSIAVLGLTGVRNAIKAKGRQDELQAEATEVETDPKTRTGGMHLIRTIVVSRKDGTTQGTIYVFLMIDPPRDKKVVDTHFGVRNATIADLVAGQGKGSDFASH
jgi:hypothetical protein